MRRSFLIPGLLLGGAAAIRVLAKRRPEWSRHLAARAGERCKSHMQHMLDRMPEGSPPRLIVNTLPRLAEQNEEILVLLREHDARLRELGLKDEAA